MTLSAAVICFHRPSNLVSSQVSGREADEMEDRTQNPWQGCVVRPPLLGECADLTLLLKTCGPLQGRAGPVFGCAATLFTVSVHLKPGRRFVTVLLIACTPPSLTCSMAVTLKCFRFLYYFALIPLFYYRKKKLHKGRNSL